MQGYGLRIIQARRAKDWTQAQLCQAAGISPVPVSKWENEKTMPQLESWHRLSSALGVSVEWLKTGVNQPAPDLSSIGTAELLQELGRRGLRFAVSHG